MRTFSRGRFDVRWASRILIIDPLTLKIKWQYSNKDFFSAAEGAVQALPNGNFLVTESFKGHVFEVTPDKRIVWEYYCPSDKFNVRRFPDFMQAPRDLEDKIARMTLYPEEMIDHLLGEK